MRPNRFVFLALSLFSGSLVALAGCGGNGKFVNSAPSDLSITTSKCYVETDGTVVLSGSATDEDGDSLTYSWKASAGSFDPPAAVGQAVNWIAPSEPGSVVITMTVSDLIDKSKKTQEITVCQPFPTSITRSTTIGNAGDTYIINNIDPVRVGEGITLTINPGVTIVIDSNLGGFEVFGRIVAEGSPGQHIRLIANTCSGGSALWGGIYIQGDNSEAVLKHAEIGDDTDGIQASTMATLVLDSCEVYSTSNTGISVQDMSVASIHACKIWDNGSGITVVNSRAQIEESSIRYSTGVGIDLTASQDSIQAVIERCEIANHGLDGITLWDRANPTIHNCSIFSNGESSGSSYDIRLEGGYMATDSIHAENNYWGLGNNTAVKIAGLIYDKNDNPGQIGAYVAFSPWLASSPVQQQALEKRLARGRAWGK